MKTLTTFILLAVTAVIAGSCSKNDSSSTSTEKSNLSGGTWKVTYFTDSGKDETSDFSGYTFTFGTGGALTVTSPSSATFTGSWSIKSGSTSGGYGSGSSDPDKLVMTISGDTQMTKISKSWMIVKLTSTDIWLSDDNTSSGEVVYFAH
jgi:hypothetical protein